MVCIKIPAKNKPIHTREKFKIVDFQETARWIIHVHDGIIIYFIPIISKPLARDGVIISEKIN